MAVLEMSFTFVYLIKALHGRMFETIHSFFLSFFFFFFLSFFLSMFNDYST